MKSASSTASGSGQQRKKRPIPDTESRVRAEDTSEMGTGESTVLPRAPSANTRRRIVVKPEPVAVTTQEAVHGYCESALRIASVEQIEVGNIMELSITGQVLKWARRSNFSGILNCKRSSEPETFVVLDEKNPHIRTTRDGMKIKLDANNGVCTIDMWICFR